jgi:hypothetical protein
MKMRLPWQLEETHKDNGKMMSPEIMVTMVGIVTVPSGTIVKMVGLIKVSSRTKANTVTNYSP